ncbi:hypothetical protein PVAND_010462 [Polypedilum vanderplanki]|uniref:Cytochrome b5 heme-binding domain-containing protein n=1 Tax=Polypedilum vanderplanki TaxID=319348 RepID=A0A9J6CFZ9_POLVA|nr:hypothetical protein PVAND_010462 [Polypedilum vanderplanki]
MIEKIKIKDLREHCTEESAWIAIRSKVYDITSFVARHPGGKDQLRFGIGRDATTVFETYHNVENVQRVLNKLPIVGDLIDSELPQFNEASEFHKTINLKVRKRFHDAGLDMKNSHKAWLTYSVIFLSITLSFYQQYFGYMSNSTILQILCASILGFFCAQLGLHIMHDASHFSITHNPLVWKYLGSTHDFVNGASFIAWIYQHTFGHHPYTNIPNADPDIHVQPERDFRRILNYQKWFNYYKLQHIYAPILYAGLGVKTRLQDLRILYIQKSNGPISVNPLTIEQNILTIGGKIFFIFYRFLLPVLFGFTWTRVFALFLLSDIVTSYWLALTFQANHVVEEVMLPFQQSKDVDWAKMQVMTTVDYAINSVLTQLAVGSLNFQTVHHLFPGVLQHHYPLIQDIIYDECRKNNVKYNTKETLIEAVAAHIQFLKNMGEKEI